MGWLEFRRSAWFALPALSAGRALDVTLALALASATLAACGTPREEQARQADPRFATRLESAADFGRLQGEQWAVKFLSRVDGRSPPEPLDQACTFQNTAQFPLHLEFLRALAGLETLDFDAYLALVMKRTSRVLWAGELRPFSGARHPRTGRTGVMGLFVYADEHEPLETDELVQVYRRIEGCIPYARDALVLVGADTAQAARFREQAGALAQLGISVADHAALTPAVAAEGYSVGDGYGYLRLVPPGAGLPADVGPRDLLVIEGASEDIGLVAGLVTALPQNVHSHLNLRLREKAVPNARISDVFADQALLGLDGRLARLRVDAGTAAVEPTTLEEATAFWTLRVDPVRLPAPNLDETRLSPVASLAAADATAYGRKAANLGELYRALPEPNRVSGFAIPFSRYESWMRDHGLAERVTALLADPRIGADAVYRRSALEALRDAIERADVSPDVIAELAATAEQVFGTASTLPLRFRSSSNVEDGERLSGAGLHDSARGCLADDLDADTSGPSACLSESEREALEVELERRRAELAMHPERIWLVNVIDDLSSDLTRERTAARALKKVYASLWNDRAFEERAYFGIDQQLASMAVMVNPSFVLERVDAVAVTNLSDADGAEPYTRLVSQIGGQPVVRAIDPTLTAETLTFRRAADGSVRDVRRLVSSSLSPTPIWSTAQLAQLSELSFLAREHFAAHVYPDVEPLRLDLEIKLTNDDRIVLKQARPYISTEP